jgi:hypothetical protein
MNYERWAQRVILQAAKRASLVKCRECGKSFMAGYLTGRSRKAKFCSTQCRVRSWRKRTLQ